MLTRKVWNLYNDDSIASQKIIFNIHSTQDIEEFWLYYQEKSIIKSEDITYFVLKYLFDYTSKFLEKANNYDIIIEYTTDIQYITFWHQNYSELLKDAYLNLKEYPYFNLKINEEKATFQVLRIEEVNHKEIAQQKAVINAPKELVLQQKTVINTPKELIIYDFLNPDDLTNLQEINDELLNQMFYISSSQIDEDRLSTIITQLEIYISIFTKYEQLESIGDEVSSFRNILEDNIHNIIEDTSPDLNLFFEGIITNLKNWTDMSFTHGIENINYYNASINSDIIMIKQLLKIDVEVEIQDDIFF